MSEIDDVTVAKVLAIVDHPSTVVLEFGERGDLKTFLRQLVGPPTTTANVFDGDSIHSRTTSAEIRFNHQTNIF